MIWARETNRSNLAGSQLLPGRWFYIFKRDDEYVAGVSCRPFANGRGTKVLHPLRN